MENFTTNNNFNKAFNLMKGKIRFKITLLKEVETENGKSYKVIDSKFENISAAELKKSIIEDNNNGIEHTVEIVNNAPVKFQFNVIYLLANGRAAWVFLNKENK